jgi:regulator of sigma E protease
MSNLDQSWIDVMYERDGQSFVEIDVNVSVAVQMAGITNTYIDPDTEEITIYRDPIIGQSYGRARSDGGLLEGDIIESIIVNNVSHDIESWDDIISVFRQYDRGDLVVVYERDGNLENAYYSMISANALTKLGSQPIVYQLGVSPSSSFDWNYSLLYAPRRFYQDVTEVFTTLGLLFSPKEDLGIGDLSGPVGIYTLVSSTASQGLLSIIVFTGFLSINIGLLNLLPIPALDGGRLVFLGIEAVTRKPLPRKVENTINNAMFLLLLIMFVFVTYNDILRLIRG